jgi:hypothetical protein
MKAENITQFSIDIINFIKNSMMDEMKKQRVLSVLNSNTAQVANVDEVSMGLGSCNIKCLRVKVSPGSYLSKA